MLDGRRQKDRKSPGQFEIRGNIDNRNEGSTHIPNLIVGLAKVNTLTRIPKKVNTRSSAPPVVPSSSQCANKASGLTPEILIRAQAKTLEAINKITNRVDKLEHRIEDIYRKVKQMDRFNNVNRGEGGGQIKKGDSSFSSGITPNLLSDDSGDELSRTTNETGQDDDELLSLLNQITKFFDSIKQTAPMGFGLAGNAQTTASSASKQSIHKITGGNHHQPLQLLPSPSAIKKKLFSSMDHSRQIDCPDSTSSPQSFRALIFESNVEHFLANLDCVPEPVRTNGHYYPPSMPIIKATLIPLNQRQHHQLVKSHPIIGSRQATETLHTTHKQPNQR